MTDQQREEGVKIWEKHKPTLVGSGAGLGVTAASVLIALYSFGWSFSDVGAVPKTIKLTADHDKNWIEHDEAKKSEREQFAELIALVTKIDHSQDSLITEIRIRNAIEDERSGGR